MYMCLHSSYLLGLFEDINICHMSYKASWFYVSKLFTQTQKQNLNYCLKVKFGCSEVKSSIFLLKSPTSLPPNTHDPYPSLPNTITPNTTQCFKCTSYIYYQQPSQLQNWAQGLKIKIHCTT